MFKGIKVGAAKKAILVAGVCAEDLKLPSLPADLKRAGEELQTLLKSKGTGFKGDSGETIVSAGGHVALGLGKHGEVKAESLRSAGAKLVKKLDRMNVNSIRLAMANASGKNLHADETGRAMGEGLGLANWRVDFFAGKATKIQPAKAALTIDVTDKTFAEGLTEGLELADHVNYARKIAATPPNVCTPMWLAGEMRKMAREVGLKCSVIDYAQAKKLGMGGIVSVGMGSAAKPCLIVLEHKPRTISKRARGETLALVGKSITYDTGGYSLKVNNGMKGMKYDKCGGMAVIGAMRAIAAMKLPMHVVGLLPAAENMVSDDSYRPDDIIQMYNGVSVEVTNTDAEGRLVLADARAYACKDLRATAMVDLATLTGGIVVALGHFCSGVFCNDEKLLRRVEEASTQTGEKIWRMPLWPEHRDFMRSQHADLLNSNPSRNAHPVQGAAFLSYFVDEKLPWAHIDIAGVGNVDRDTDLCVQGPTGYGVRMLVEMVQNWAG
ncbi:MAG TPA: leucyl aminopeptidase family protein [Phycisphaerales bacterium]|nr:leucyl aminopeptidase family protein [Phycisphaerales bacterium]